MSTKIKTDKKVEKEKLTLSQLQENIGDNYKSLINLHCQNEKLIKSNSDEIDQTINLVNNFKRDMDREFVKSYKTMKVAFIGLSFVIVVGQFINYVL